MRWDVFAPFGAYHREQSTIEVQVGTQGNQSDISGRYFQTKINGNIGNSAVTSSIEEVMLSLAYMHATHECCLQRCSTLKAKR